MKILYLNAFSVVQGGAERLLFDTCSELLQRGHKVAIVIANDDRRAKNPEYWPASINRYFVPELILPLGDRRTHDRHRRSPAYRATIRYLQDIINIESPDLIHVHNFSSLEFFKDLTVGVPLLRTVHSYENLCATHLKRLPDGSICTYPKGKECAAICGCEESFRSVRVRRENNFSRLRFTRFLAISTYIRDVLIANRFPAARVRVLSNFSRMKQQLTKAYDVVFYLNTLQIALSFANIVTIAGNCGKEVFEYQPGPQMRAIRWHIKWPAARIYSVAS